MMVAAGQTFDQMADFDDLLGVEAHGRLIEDDHVGIVDQGLRQADALLIAAGEPLDQFVLLVHDVGLFQGVRDAFRALIRRNILDARDEIEIGPDGHIRIHGRIFGEVADVTPHFHGIVEHVEAGDARGARSGGHVAGQDAHGGGLPGAIGAEKTEDFTFIHRERNVVHGRHRAVRLRQILNFNQLHSSESGNQQDCRTPPGRPLY